MSIGFIKLHRKLTEWEWYSDINATRLFVHLLITANYQTKKWRGLEIKRGHLVTSLESLSKATSLSVQQTRTSLDKLKLTSEITIKPTNRFTLIELVNYGAYQDKNDDDNKPNNKPTTNKQQTNNKQITTTKEEKEIKEDKKIIKTKEKEIEIPDFIDAELWNEYLKMRTAKKATPTEKAVELVIKKLTRFENKKIGAANESLENSIESNYTGVFEPKTNFKTEKSRLAWKN